MRRLIDSSRVTAFWIATLAILALGLRPTPATQLFDNADKLYHSLAFASLTLAGAMAYPRLAWRWLLLALLALGGLIEWGQTLWPQRTASLVDMAFNMLGVLCSLALLPTLRRYNLAAAPVD